MVWAAWQVPLQNMGRKQNHAEGDRVQNLLRGGLKGRKRRKERGGGRERRRESCLFRRIKNQGWLRGDKTSLLGRVLGSRRSFSLKGTGYCLGSPCQVTWKVNIILTVYYIGFKNICKIKETITYFLNLNYKYKIDLEMIYLLLLAEYHIILFCTTIRHARKEQKWDSNEI